jgi:hypothetical protein
MQHLDAGDNYLSNNKSDTAENSGKQITSNREKAIPIISTNSENNPITALRTDVDELSTEVKTAVGDLKKSIADIRSSVSEMENPFNLLREVSNEKEIENIAGGKLPTGVKSLILGKQQENDESEKEPIPESENITQMESVIEKPKKMLIPLPQKSPKSSAYLEWIWNLLDAGLTAENIRQLACTCELMNYLPSQTNVLIYSLAVTAEKIRELGFGKGQLLLFIYKAAAISKTTLDSEDMEALIDITEQQLTQPKSNRGTS